MLYSGNKERSAQVVPAMQDQPGVKEDPSQDREDSGVIKFDPRNVDGCSWPSILCGAIVHKNIIFRLLEDALVSTMEL